MVPMPAVPAGVVAMAVPAAVLAVAVVAGMGAAVVVMSLSHTPRGYRRSGQAGFSQTETCWPLSLVKGARDQWLQRSRRVMPARRAIRSSSEGQT
jgi:hypothetical protein